MNGATVGEQSKSTVLNVQLRGKCPTKTNKNDAHMENRMIVSKSQSEFSHSQQRMGGDAHVSVLPPSLPIVAEQSFFSQHSEIATSKNVNDAVTSDENERELASQGGVATPLNNY